MKDVGAVLFDWGGTLCSVGGQRHAFDAGAEQVVRAAAEAGYDVSAGGPRRFLETFHHEHDHVAAREPYEEIRIEAILADWLADETGRQPPPPVLGRLGETFWRPWVGCLGLLGDADRVLRELRRRGYRIGLVSNVATPPHLCHEHLESVGLGASIEVFALSSAVGYRKPHPAIYRHAIEGLSANGHAARPENMLFVGDSPEYDVALPASLGMKTALLPDAMGFWDPDHHASVEADLRISHVGDLLEHLA